MANLKGGNFQKQIKDAFHRLEAFGVGRVGKNDNLTHSHKLAEKRLMLRINALKFKFGKNADQTLMSFKNLADKNQGILVFLSVKTQQGCNELRSPMARMKKIFRNVLYQTIQVLVTY